jgi:acyl dehydratase
LEYAEITTGLERSLTAVVSGDLIASFALLTGDRHPLHTDPIYAANCGYTDILAHGMLVSSFASTLVGMHLPGRNALLLSQSFAYKKPVHPDSTITIRGVVRTKNDAFRIIVIDVSVMDHSGEMVAQGEIKVQMRR